MHKPADITVPTILQSRVTVEHIHLDASNGQNPRIIIDTLTNFRKACRVTSGSTLLLILQGGKSAS